MRSIVWYLGREALLSRLAYASVLREGELCEERVLPQVLGASSARIGNGRPAFFAGSAFLELRCAEITGKLATALYRKAFSRCFFDWFD